MATVSEAATGVRLPLRVRKGFAGELWAEFFGCFILISFGDGVVAMLWALQGSGRSSAGPLQSSGDWLLITWGWCLAVAFAVYVAGGITGAHINPAITLGAAMRKQLPWSKVPGYWVAQVVGCFVGAALVFAVYNQAINHWDQVGHCLGVAKGCTPIVKGTAASLGTYSTFATFPAPYFGSWVGPFVDQVVGTFFLALFVWAITDEFNLPVGSNMTPFIVGMVVMAIGISFGANAGYAINPARDFGPRLFAWIAGWGKEAMPGNYGNVNDYFWIPIVGPLVGAAIASWLYDFAIRDILMARKGPEPGLEAEGQTVQDRPPANEA
ncbi:MAG: MIP/aquaporin family protein [Solirubrobacteraceae bacterium]